jgi:hypothetical protein
VVPVFYVVMKQFFGGRPEDDAGGPPALADNPSGS